MNSHLNIEDQTILPMDYNNLLYNDILVYDCSVRMHHHTKFDCKGLCGSEDKTQTKHEQRDMVIRETQNSNTHTHVCTKTHTHTLHNSDWEWKFCSFHYWFFLMIFFFGGRGYFEESIVY